MKLSEIIQMILPTILNGILSICGCFLLYVFMRLGKWLGAKIEYINQKSTELLKRGQMVEFQDTLNLATKITQDIIDALNDTMKKEFIESSKTGKLTKEQQERLLNKAFSLICSELSEHHKEILETGIGDLKEWVRTKIENAVTNSKKGDNDKSEDKFDFVSNPVSSEIEAK